MDGPNSLSFDSLGYIPYIFALIIFILPFIYDRKNEVQYHWKFFVYYVTVSSVAIGCIPVFALNAKNVKNVLYISYVLKHVTKLIGVEWELDGEEHLAEDRGAIIVSNHQSTLDILGMFNFWNVMGKCAAVAKKEVFYVWPFGIAAYLAGVVFIDRSSASKSYNKLNETSKLTQRDKTKIFMFAEGTRNINVNKTRKLLPFKKGAFRMAISCQVPIIPVVYSPYYFMDHKKHYFGQGKIRVKALPAIPTENLTEDDIDDLMKKTCDVMTKTFEELFDQTVRSLPHDHPMYKMWAKTLSE